MNAQPASDTPPAVHEKIAVYYATDHDPEKAGQGLATAPFVGQALGQDSLSYWMMSPAEQTALVFLLQQQRPDVAIEIGTRFGGSLQVLSRYCGKVYSLDIDPDVPRRLEGRFPNVEYIVGPSDRTLPMLIDRIRAGGERLGFALVDGDHSSEGVRSDINNLLRYEPLVPFFIIMHDSFNPQCRHGLRTSDWAANLYVHAVELDFVPGVVNPSPKFSGQLWGGLALAWLLPEKRHGHFEVTGSGEMTFRTVVAATSRQSLRQRLGFAIRRAKRLLLRDGTAPVAS
jgi:hypothetical protein